MKDDSIFTSSASTLNCSTVMSLTFSKVLIYDSPPSKGLFLRIA
jgi:hypothetical protein